MNQAPTQPPSRPPRINPRPGWYADPWGVAPYRWWDGETWTYRVTAQTRPVERLHASRAHRPWMSAPVGAALFLFGLPIVLAALDYPVAVLLAVVPLAIVLPVLVWLDRVEPEPLTARIHALLWGAVLSIGVASLVNGAVEGVLGFRAATLFSAPVVEEVMKTLGIAWAVRRREVDGLMDGVIYAGWTAIGFAAMEDFFYFADASDFGNLAEVFVLRALLTPFAHPLFTVWPGLGIGFAVARGRSVWGWGSAGCLVAIGLHMTWNASLTYFEPLPGSRLWVMVALFVVLFLGGMVALMSVRRRDKARFMELVPWLASHYRLSAAEIALFSGWSEMLARRRSLSRQRRKDFDEMHAALARLAHLHDQPSATNRATEAVLVAQLEEARRNLAPL